ncbi:MAG: hypothetical protein NC191_06610 [Muribaculaceae bacterium]|nr:hypothetical protein [Muribaculaceae bacterium]
MQIRRLTYFDYRKLKKLVSYLCTDDNDKLAKTIMEEPAGFLNAMLPLSMKFKSESFILTEQNEILGLITIVTTPGNPYKINITRLIFKENLYEAGKQLIDFVVQKYGAKGAQSFMVTIDECHDELFNLFINGCGFRQCASETLWKIEKPIPQKNKLKWRYAQKSDSKKIAELYNSELINMYKPSLTRYHNEFEDTLFKGFADGYKMRCLIEEEKNLLAYFSITTNDNLNYILDMTLNSGYELDYDKIINIMLCEIAGKKRAFFPLIKQKKYVKNAERFGEYLSSKGFIPIQTQQILVKDFYKPIKEESTNWKVFILGENQVTQG